MYKLIENQIRISVRNLVEFVLRSGDLDNRRSASAQKEAMLAGSRLHRKIQKRMGADYRAEVGLKMTVPLEGGIELVLEGRADGIIQGTDRVIIDEIKGVYFDVNSLEDMIPVHRAQALCYAYIYAVQNSLPGANIQLTYCNLDTEEIRRFQEWLELEALEETFQEYMREYGKWARFLYEHRVKRRNSIQGMEFPYPWREGQKDLAVSVYRTIARQKTLFIQAPTGIGKTLSVLFPAVQAMGQKLADKLFYLTAKTITRSVAEEGLEVMRSQGLVCSGVTLTAKEKMCVLDSPDCNPESCPRAKGHFDRVNAAVFDLISHRLGITREDVLEYAQKHQVCPFEMSLDVTYWVDVVIGDYNYVFDPTVRLQRFFADGSQGEYVFLVDEAHNLVERAREMYSAELCKEELLAAKKLFAGKSERLVKLLDKANRAMLELKRECDSYQVLENGEGLGALTAAVMQIYDQMEKYRENHPGDPDQKEQASFFFVVRDFLSVYDCLDDNYVTYLAHREDGSFMVKLFCVHPAARLRACMEQGLSTVFFSATLLPIRYYKELLSNCEEDYAVYARSPFDPARRLLAVGRDVSSRYTRRNQAEFEKIAEYILQMAEARKGNYLVFFPSYAYLEQVNEILEEAAGEDCRILAQGSRMTEGEKEDFLDAFSEDGSGTLIGLCVMGGIFSEGIDLKKERLIGVAIVGTGLPQVCAEREILKTYFDNRQEKGFDFAYLYPGMNKVLQAAGRLIRTAEDYGVILLLDDRFLRAEEVSQFPQEWADYQVTDRRSVGKLLGNFWAGLE